MKGIFILAILFPAIASGQQEQVFVFGTGSEKEAVRTISSPVRYSDDKGYGFDFENSNKVTVVDSVAPGEGYCTADLPFYFSVKLPEGCYRVQVLLGNPQMPSVTVIKAEARRIMLANYPLEKGQSGEVAFNVSVRSPVISGTDSILLKPREYNYMNWDNRLTLEFSGKGQAVHRISIRPLDQATTLFLAGNSTVTDQDCEPWASWGQMITCYFDTSVVVANFAESGASLASFKGRKRLDKVMGLIRPGDYLFIEFGHNDQKRKGEGIGPWESFTDLLVEFVTRTREKGAIPVLITPTQRRSFDETGKITDTHGDYPAAMRKVASDLEVKLIDLNEMTRTLYEAWGPDVSRSAFVQYPAGTFPGQKEELKDNTHFNAFGANEIACCILQGIIDEDIGLKEHITGFAGDYDPAMPHSPDRWNIPESPRYESKKPEGN
jgi:lysophospholipase L1-like esterase